MHLSRRSFNLLALPLACWLFAATPSAAQAEAEPSRGWLSDAAAAFGNGFGGALDRAGATLRTAWSFVLPEAPFDYVPERLGESDLAFIAMMQAAGLSLTEIEAGGGLLPDVRYRFVASREPSAADYARAARALTLHKSSYSGLRATCMRSHGRAHTHTRAHTHIHTHTHTRSCSTGLRTAVSGADHVGRVFAVRVPGHAGCGGGCGQHTPLAAQAASLGVL